MNNLQRWTAHDPATGGTDNYIGERPVDYFVGPSITRDSGPLERSNFKVALERLGGESEEDGVEVHRFGHWACGWYESIMVHQLALEKVAELRRIESDLENYPVLCDQDYSDTEYGEFQESWELWGYSDFIGNLPLDNCDRVRDYIEDNRAKFEPIFYRYLMDNSGEPYFEDGGGVAIDTELAASMQRSELAAIVRGVKK